MKKKSLINLSILIIGIIFVAIIGVKTYAQLNRGDEDGCDRRLVVTVLNSEDVDPFCDVDVRLVFSDGTVYSTPFIQGQDTYEFYRTVGFSGSITAKLVPLNCDDCSGIHRARYFSSMPCNSYYFTTVWVICE